MNKKLLAVLAFVFLITGVGFSQIRGVPMPGNVRSAFIKKFLVLRNLYRLKAKASAKSQNVIDKKILEVIFRGREILSLDIDKLNFNASLNVLASNLNDRITYIYSGLKNFKGCLEVADLNFKEDRKMMRNLMGLISVKLKNFAGDSMIPSVFYRLRENWNECYDQVLANISGQSEHKEHNLNALDKLKQFTDLAEYLYQEQIQWTLAWVFRLETIKSQLNQDKSGRNISVTPEFNLSYPPKVFFPQYEPGTFDLK
jgi:hypothetical protein